MARIPVAFDATYVGRKPASSFTPRGETEPVQVPARVKFLHQSPDGDAELIEITGTQLDRVVPAFDYESLGGGERVHVEGVAVLPGRGSERDAYVQVTRCEIV